MISLGLESTMMLIPTDSLSWHHVLTCFYKESIRLIFDLNLNTVLIFL